MLDALSGKVNLSTAIMVITPAKIAEADYLTGTNHILPPGGSAKRFSGLSVETFLESMTYQSPSKETLRLMSSDITNLASSEGPYTEHIRSIEIREE